MNMETSRAENGVCLECFVLAHQEHERECKWYGYRINRPRINVANITGVDAVLAERGARYGKFSTHASIAQMLKLQLRRRPNFDELDSAMIEALDMICHKIAGIVNGDPNYADNWVDIAGYAQLIVNILEGEETPK
jgi:hypothetical protein